MDDTEAGSVFSILMLRQSASGARVLFCCLRAPVIRRTKHMVPAADDIQVVRQTDEGLVVYGLLVRWRVKK